MALSTTVLSILCAILVILLAISVFYNIKHGLLILKMQDAIEESLDKLDSKYNSISKVLEIPIFFDSVEVRQVISDIGSARDSILSVARELTGAILEKEKGDLDGNQKE